MSLVYGRWRRGAGQVLRSDANGEFSLRIDTWAISVGALLVMGVFVGHGASL